MVDAELKNAHILIIDDHKANVEVLQDFLEMQGYQNILSTTDSRQVLQLYESFKPDLILLDLAMPYLSGFEVMELLKPFIGANIFLPILVLTADITAESRKNSLAGGAHDFLTKPFHLLDVELKIKNLLFTGHLQKKIVQQTLLLEDAAKERTLDLEKTNNVVKFAKQKAEIINEKKATLLLLIADEIRIPLNRILNFGAMLAESELTKDSKQDFLNCIHDLSEQLLKTITNLAGDNKEAVIVKV